MDDMARRKAEKDELEHRIQELDARIRLAANPSSELASLGERADCHLRLSKLLRAIPAAESERWALNGLDPTHLAMLAQKDAKRGADAAPSDPAFQRRLPILDEIAVCKKGEAHVLLEQYDAAREAFLAALSVDSSDAAATAGLRAATDAMAEQAAPSPSSNGATPKRARAAIQADLDDWECALCLKLLWEPIATPCAHMFCRPCFARACDHSNKCPACRTVLHVGRAIPVLTQLRSFLVKSFPQEYAARGEEESAAPAGDGEPPLPLFVMAAMFPGERMRLHIFEPRYRLLVRRCMEGSRRLGMAVATSDGDVFPVATECEILECQPLPDGRFYLEIAGVQRFRVAETWEQDGYRVAKPQPLSDEVPAAEGEEAEQLAQLSAEVEAHADALAARISELGSSLRASRLADLLEQAGPKPGHNSPNRPEALGFWAAAMVQLNTHDQLQLLQMTDSAERLRFIRAEFEKLPTSERCQMM